RNQIYDFTAERVTGFEKLSIDATDTVAVSHAGLAGFQTILGGTGSTIRTSESSLDLTGISVSGAVITSTSASGTTFQIDNASTASQIRGGAGFDVIVDATSIL